MLFETMLEEVSTGFKSSDYLRTKSLAAFCKLNIFTENNFSQVKNPKSEALLFNLHISISV